ncbi:MAG: aldose epimerase family protein [Cetobacterium sp.]
MKIIKKFYGLTKEKEKVYVYKMIGKNIEVEILNYGGIIKRILIPDKYGVRNNIVASFDSFKEYERTSMFVGCITGRVAGRIKNGVLRIKDKIYQLDCNEGRNHLHGGYSSLNKKLWNDVAIRASKDTLKLTLRYKSCHLENKFPAEIDYYVSYILKEDSLEIRYLGIPDRETYTSLTNHTFFNLSGNFNKNILEHKICLMADKYIKVDSEKIPTEIVFTQNSIFNLTKSYRIGDILNSEDDQLKLGGNGIDHGFVLEKIDSPQCLVEDLETGRYMTVETDQPVIVFYTANQVRDDLVLYKNIKPMKHFGFCLETQDYPDIQNLKKEAMEIYDIHNPYVQKTIFKFGIISR